jgi:hypothetical protein
MGTVVWCGVMKGWKMRMRRVRREREEIDPGT